MGAHTYAIKTQCKTRYAPYRHGFGCLELCVYDIRELDVVISELEVISLCPGLSPHSEDSEDSGGGEASGGEAGLADHQASPGPAGHLLLGQGGAAHPLGWGCMILPSEIFSYFLIRNIC